MSVQKDYLLSLQKDYLLLEDIIEVKFYCPPCCVEKTVDEILCLLDVLFSRLPFYLPSQRIHCLKASPGYSLYLRLQHSSDREDIIDDLDYLYYKACKDNPRLKNSYVHLLKSPCYYP
ncbi:hypothetical protein [Cedratvirus kamchatka]|uniref:Uncharacterized protein n=1 Tax=Cedratvirus kamchatka TaxID=2716914 RepID=A0A6G8MX93_9VIRU|nr:hypothetical protein [Cedratvirus kamchatka]